MNIKWGTKVRLGERRTAHRVIGERLLNGERAVQLCASADYGDANTRISENNRDPLKDLEAGHHDLIARTVPIADLVKDFRGGYRERYEQMSLL